MRRCHRRLRSAIFESGDGMSVARVNLETITAVVGVLRPPCRPCSSLDALPVRAGASLDLGHWRRRKAQGGSEAAPRGSGEAARWYRATVRSTGASETSLLSRERGQREGDELDLCLVDRYTSVRNGRHAHMSGAGEGATMRVGSYDMRRVRRTQVAARRAVARPSRRPCFCAFILLAHL